MSNKQNVSIGRRLLSILYDSLIIFFIIIITTLIVQQVVVQLELVNLEKIQITKDGKTANVIPDNSIMNVFLKSLWGIISFGYYSHYWTSRGQTPGMRVWKITAVNQQGQLISWSQSLIRYMTAFVGLGLLTILFNKQKLALQDILSKTKIINL